MEIFIRIVFIFTVLVSLFKNIFCFKCLICNDIDDRNYNLHDYDIYPILNSKSDENHDPFDFGFDNHDSISYERDEDESNLRNDYHDSRESRRKPKSPTRNNNYYEPTYPTRGNKNENAYRKLIGGNNDDNARKKPTGGNDSDNTRKKPTGSNDSDNARKQPNKGNDNNNVIGIQSRNFGSEKEGTEYDDKKNDPVNFEEEKGTTSNNNRSTGVEMSDQTKDKTYIFSFQDPIEGVDFENKFSPEFKGFKKLTKTKFFYQAQPVRPVNEIVAKKETIYYIE